MQATLNHGMLRWLWLGLLALVELIWLSIRIDFCTLSGKAGWWAEPLSHANIFAPIVLASLAVGVVIGRSRARARVCWRAGLQDTRCRPWPLILAQLVAFVTFFSLSVFVVEGGARSSGFSDLWIIAFATAGFAAAVFWLLAALPARAWVRLARQGWSVVLVALLIGAAAWALGLLTGMTWETVRGPTFLVVQWLLQACGQDVVSEQVNLILGTKQFRVSIQTACSGYEGMGLVAAFVGTYWWLFRHRLRFPQAYFFLPCAILIMWLVNAVRLAGLVLVGTYVSPQIAVGGFHSQVGWLCFIGVALGMVAVTQRMRFFYANEAEPTERVGEIRPTTVYLAPLVALLAVTMVTGALLSGFDWLYPARVLAAGGVIWLFWRRSLTWPALAQSWSWRAVAIGVAVFAIWIALERVTGRPDEGSSIAKALGEMPAGLSAAWLFFRVVGSVVTVPIAEELAFRGYLLRRLLSADFDQLTLVRFTWLSFLLSSVLFGALHGRWLAGTVAGMCYAFAMYRRGKVADAVIAHATTNALIAANVLILGNWGLW